MLCTLWLYGVMHVLGCPRVCTCLCACVPIVNYACASVCTCMYACHGGVSHLCGLWEIIRQDSPCSYISIALLSFPHHHLNLLISVNHWCALSPACLARHSLCYNIEFMRKEFIDRMFTQLMWMKEIDLFLWVEGLEKRSDHELYIYIYITKNRWARHLGTILGLRSQATESISYVFISCGQYCAVILHSASTSVAVILLRRNRSRDKAPSKSPTLYTLIK